MNRTLGTPPDPLLGARLRDANRQDGSASHIADLLTHASRDFSPKGTQSWARIESALAARTWVPLRRRWLWPAIAMTSLSIATAAVAGPVLVGWLKRNNTTTTQTVGVARPLVDKTTSPIPLLRAPVAPLTKSDAPAERSRKHAPARRLSMAQQPATASALAEESELLGTALAALRKHKDTAQTLAILDMYDRTFPRGELSTEAQHTRIEALLLQRRTSEALVILDRSAFSSRDRDMQWRVLRGELRAQSHRCADAHADFSAVLQSVAEGRVAERALFGRASCFVEAKNDASAKSALQQYVARFPGGMHAAQVRKALGANAP